MNSENKTELPLTHAATASSTAGEKLRYTRESKGLTQQEVARALCLPLHIIDALEKEDFHVLPSPVFVQGYLKNYARFLQLPLLLAADNAVNTAFQPQPQPVASWLPLIKPIFLKCLNYGIFIGILLLIFLWRHNR